MVEDIRWGGNKAYFAKTGYETVPGWAYRDMWWVSHNDHGVFMARGIHGQNIYIVPKAETIIVRYASFPIAGNVANDPFTLPTYIAIAKYGTQG